MQITNESGEGKAVKTCPVCKQQTLTKKKMGEEMGSAWYCTNPSCDDHDKLKNLDADDD